MYFYPFENFDINDEKKKLECKEYILSNKNRINEPVGYFYDFVTTSLHSAITSIPDHSIVEIVNCLLDNGADINIKKDKDSVDDTVDDNYGSTPLIYAAKLSKLPVVKLLINRGADLHLKKYQGNTALLEAVAWLAHLEIIKLLLDSGANINDTNIDGNNALMIFITKWLERLPAEIYTYKNPNYIKYGTDVIDLLVERKIQINNENMSSNYYR